MKLSLFVRLRDKQWEFLPASPLFTNLLYLFLKVEVVGVQQLLALDHLSLNLVCSFPKCFPLRQK
jgi:hypothetical protein